MKSKLIILAALALLSLGGRPVRTPSTDDVRQQCQDAAAQAALDWFTAYQSNAPVEDQFFYAGQSLAYTQAAKWLEPKPVVVKPLNSPQRRINQR